MYRQKINGVKPITVNKFPLALYV